MADVVPVEGERPARAWDRVLVTQQVPIHRSGWWGAWDAFKSAITGDIRPSYPAPVTFSVYVKDAKDGMCMWGAQIEIDERKTHADA